MSPLGVLNVKHRRFRVQSKNIAIGDRREAKAGGGRREVGRQEARDNDGYGHTGGHSGVLSEKINFR